MTDTAIFAAGCFWGVEDAFRKIPGVIEVVSGYTGGTVEDPSYEQVCTGTTGHAEAVQVEFDPEKVSYDDLLKDFWTMHDPTQVNRQGPDVGYQYRSAIFTNSDEQRELAEVSKAALASSGKLGKTPIATVIEPAGPFYKAEEYHQRYFEKHPGQAACHI